MTARSEKMEQVAALHAKFGAVKGAILSDYRGLNVQQMGELRNRLRAASVELQVVKNTLARRAAEDTDFASLTEHFVGPTSIAFTEDDVVAMAKVSTVAPSFAGSAQRSHIPAKAKGASPSRQTR